MSTKIWKVVASGTLSRRERFPNGNIDGRFTSIESHKEGKEFDDLPDGTPIEIVALVEPERKLIRPEEATWEKSGLVGTRWDLIKTHVCAHVHKVPGAPAWYWTTPRKMGDCDSFEAAQQAAEHALADAGLYGFGWEGDEQYLAYSVRGLRRPETFDAWQQGCATRVGAMKSFNHWRKHHALVVMYGITKDLQLVELDRSDTKSSESEKC